MAITSINVGAVPDDGSGDELRDAFIKVNANFVYLDAPYDRAINASIDASFAGYAAKFGSRLDVTAANDTTFEIGNYKSMIATGGAGTPFKAKILEARAVVAKPGAGDVYVRNEALVGEAGFSGQNFIGDEMDIHNDAVDFDALGYPYGCGFFVTYSGSKRMFASYASDGAVADRVNYAFYSGNVAARQADFYANSDATAGVLIGNTRAFGVDMLGSTLGAGIRLPHSTPVVIRNGANNTDLRVLSMTGFDRVMLGQDVIAIDIWNPPVLRNTVPLKSRNGADTTDLHLISLSGADRVQVGDNTVSVDVNAVMRPATFTVTQLNALPGLVPGATAICVDASAPLSGATVGTVVTGGGTAITPVFYDGSWRYY